MTHAHRVLAYVLTALAIGVVAAILIVTAVRGASAAGLCERHHMQKVYTRGGRSWRCRRVHEAALRFRPTRKVIERAAAPAIEVPLTRTVRTVPIFGGVTPHERIDRAFDKLMIFPIEDEP